MRNSKILAFTMALLVTFLFSANLTAQDEKAEQEMPEMGPTDQIKDLAWMLGTWNVTMQSKQNPMDTAWIESTAVCKYMDIFNGCGIHMLFDAEMAKMDFKGSGVISYNRQTGKWQQSWLDNMSASQNLYEGEFINDELVFAGTENWMGQEYHFKITTYNITEDRYEWKYEMSMDGGKTYYPTVNAVYTKVK